MNIVPQKMMSKRADSNPMGKKCFACNVSPYVTHYEATGLLFELWEPKLQNVNRIRFIICGFSLVLNRKMFIFDHHPLLGSVAPSLSDVTMTTTDGQWRGGARKNKLKTKKIMGITVGRGLLHDLQKYPGVRAS